MKPVIAAWVESGGSARFEANVPLLFVGRRNRRLGYSNAIDLVFLDGFQRLDPSYAEELRALGFTLSDAAATYRRHAERFVVLDRFGRFEKFCFLRWLVLAEHYGQNPVLHLDGDVVFNECPETLARLLAGHTFVLQGCPALTAIANYEWFDAYTEELTRFARDIDGYSASAWRDRAGWEDSARRKGAGSRDRPTISSDQDLLSHLIHTDRIVQANPAAVAAVAPGHVFIENSLIVGELVAERLLKYRREREVDYFGAQRVAFWHMQTDWCRYLAKHMLRERLGVLAGTGRISYGKRDRETVIGGALRKLSGSRLFPRSAIYRRFFDAGDFSEVFTESHWWQPGVFAGR